MALSDISRAEILHAVAEFDRLGRDSFLRRYGFGRATQLPPLIDGKEYDSKAVDGAAHGFLLGQEPLGCEDFSGGRTHAVKLLRDLGFHTGAALVQGGISLFAVFEGA